MTEKSLILQTKISKYNCLQGRIDKLHHQRYMLVDKIRKLEMHQNEIREELLAMCKHHWQFLESGPYSCDRSRKHCTQCGMER